MYVCNQEPVCTCSKNYFIVTFFKISKCPSVKTRIVVDYGDVKLDSQNKRLFATDMPGNYIHTMSYSEKNTSILVPSDKRIVMKDPKYTELDIENK